MWSNSEWQLGQAFVFQGAIEMCFCRGSVVTKGALREGERGIEKAVCLSMTCWLQSTSVTSIPSLQHPQPPLSSSQSLCEPVAGKLIGSICCLGGKAPLHPFLTPTSHIYTCPTGHLRHQSDYRHQVITHREREEVRETARLRGSVNLQLALVPRGYLVRQVGKLHQAGMPSRDRWFMGKRERLPHPTRCIQNSPQGLIV